MQLAQKLTAQILQQNVKGMCHRRWSKVFLQQPKSVPKAGLTKASIVTIFMVVLMSLIYNNSC
jgi:hypothetical protein